MLLDCKRPNICILSWASPKRTLLQTARDEKMRESTYWDVHKIGLYDQSGLSKADFCKKHRISQSLLHFWQKVHKASNTYAEELPAFIPIMIYERVATIDRESIIITGHGGLQV